MPVTTIWPLASSTWGNEEREALRSVIDSDLHTMGRRTRQFEQDFADYLGARYAVMVNSGSSANLLMAHATRYLGVRQGSRIILPAVGWGTSYFPFLDWYYPAFVDVDPQTLTYNLRELELALRNPCAAVLAVNMLGSSCDMIAMQKILPRGTILLEDNCESLGATYSGQFCGTFGLMGTFSFYYSHQMSTVEGGMVVTNSQEARDILVCLRAHGWTRDLLESSKLLPASLDPWEDQFRFVLPGFNVRPTEFSAAVGKVQLGRFPALLEILRANAVKFGALLAHYPDLDVQAVSGDPSWFGFYMLVKPDAPFSRSDLVAALEGRGIQSRPVGTGNILRQDVSQRFSYQAPRRGTPGADRVHRDGLYLGNHAFPLDGQLAVLKEVLDDIAGSVHRPLVVDIREGSAIQPQRPAESR